MTPETDDMNGLNSCIQHFLKACGEKRGEWKSMYETFECREKCRGLTCIAWSLCLRRELAGVELIPFSLLDNRHPLVLIKIHCAPS